MKVRVVYFALLRERLGISEELLELSADATVADALGVLCERYEILAGYRRSLLLARNQVLVPGQSPLQDGDELAILPPVSGGSEQSPIETAEEAVANCWLSREPLSAQEVIDRVSAPGQGGVALFCGMVRDHNQGKEVVRLDYEAYDAMAVRQMIGIAVEIEEASPGVRVSMAHRIGSLQVGDLAVVVAASAPHRAEAFAACRQAIERLKAEVPIWKKEFSPDGSEWLGGN